MLGPCIPIAKATLGAMVRSFRHVMHHVPLRGIGRHIHRPAGHSLLATAASPHAGVPPLMCTMAPGSLLPIGPILGADDAAYTSGVGSIGNGAAADGLLAGGGLAGSIGALTSAALLASGLAVAFLPTATTASHRPAVQRDALADTMQPLPFIAAPNVPLLAATGSAMPPVFTGAPDVRTASISGAAVPGVAAFDDAALGATGAYDPVVPFDPAASNVPTSVPEPASIALLGIGVAVTCATRRSRSNRSAAAKQTSAGLRTDEKLSRLVRPGTAAGHLCDRPRKPA